MKALLLILLFSMPLIASSKVFFQALTDHQSTHELTWNFPQPVTGWGKTDATQVLLTCSGQPMEKPSKIFWSNSQTLKLVPAKNFTPGEKCLAELNLEKEKQKDQFVIPLVRITDQRPYSLDNISEDGAFVLYMEAKVDDDLLAGVAFAEVEGLREKIQFDAVKGDLKKEMMKVVYAGEKENPVVLKPRRKFPFGKKMVLKVPEKYTYAYETEGQIREDFKVTIKCERPNANDPCSPASKISIEFNEEVLPEMIKKFKLVSGKKSWALADPMYSRATSAEFKTKLEPDTEYTVTIDGDIKDLDGRSLSNVGKFPLVVKTGAYPPLAKFPGAFGILEANADPIIPVSVRNVEARISLKKNSAVLSLNNPKIFALWLGAIDKRQDVGYGTVELRAQSIFAGSPLAVKEEIINYKAGKNETEVLGLPVKQKGLHLVELSSAKLAKSLLANQNNFYISSAVLVTNMTAHLKVGETESMVWVTTLDTGSVVPAAEVILYDCKGEQLGKNTTNEKGIATFSGANKKNLECYGGIEKLNYKILAVAKKNDDATFTLSSWNEGIENWRFNLPYYDQGASLDKAHTVFDRPIYKVTEKVHMLHLLRSQGDDGLIFSKTKYTHARIYHEESNKDWLLPLKWKDFGSSATVFTVPENAPQGTYYVSLNVMNAKKESVESVSAGQFMVKDFRVPLMRSEVHFLDRKEKYTATELLKVVGHLEFLAGGASGFTPITLRGELTPLSGTSIDDYPSHRFNFAGIDDANDYEQKILEKKLTKTDKKGDFQFDLTNLPKSNQPLNLMVEIEYLDPNGVYQTNSTQTRVYPFEKLIGIKEPEVVRTDKDANFEIVILNLKHAPLKKAEFTATLYKETHYSTRKKIIGGFYTYDSSVKREKIGEVCKGKTNDKGLANCQLKTKAAGTHYLVVESNGASGKTQFYTYGQDYAWAPQEHHDRIDLIPNEKVYQPGDTARVELKLPFEKAMILVTKERAGIKDAFLTPYDRTNPFLTIPIEKNDFPNFFLSALAVRGRIGSPAPTGLVDLARPTYKMGLQEIKVERKDNNLKIVLQTEKEKYQVRDQVKVKVKVTTMDGSPLAGTKIALSVFDEGLLLINGQSSFDAARSLIQSYSHGISTSTAQTHIIGKRHFGLKARPHGGGGGKDLKPRELFETLIYWNPELALNKAGEATVTFKLNDSLTSFKIYGLAYSQEKFGHSNTRVTATQDIMTFVGTSPEVRTKDQFSAAYTLKNISSTDKALRLELLQDNKKIKEETVTIKATESHQFSYEIVPFEKSGTSTYLLNLYEGAKKIDAIKTVQKISALEIPRVRFSDLKELSAPVEIAGLTTDPRLFGTEILFSSTLTPSLGPLREYMEQYPYSCLEQKLARYTILEDKKLKAQVDRDLSSYIDERGFLKYYPVRGRGSVLLTAYFLEINYLNGMTSPKDQILITALRSFIDGQIHDLDEWEKKAFTQLRLKAMVTLTLIKAPNLNPKWLNEIPAPKPEDSLVTLLDKWVLFAANSRGQNAVDLIQTKLKIDGSTVSLLNRKPESYDFLYGLDTTVFGRFLLLQKIMPLNSEFSKFYQANEGKFIRGYLGQRSLGHFGGTSANTYAYLLNKKWNTGVPVTGKVSVAGKSSAWKKNEAEPLLLNKEEASKNQILIHTGSGKPWADIRVLTYKDQKASAQQGIDIKMELKNLEPRGTYEVQDRVEVKLLIDVKNDLTMGAINLPLPSGVSILESSSNLYLNFEERTESKWRGYFNDVPKGSYEVKVIFRINQSGVFQIPGSRMEAMYSPDVFGEAPYWDMKVQ